MQIRSIRPITCYRRILNSTPFPSSLPTEPACTDGWWISHVAWTTSTGLSNITRPKGHAFQTCDSSSHEIIIYPSKEGRTEDFLFLVSHESLERTKSQPRSTERSLFPFSPFSFSFSFFFFPSFSKKSPHCAAYGERDGRRGEAEGEGGNNMRWGGREAACKHRPARFHG